MHDITGWSDHQLLTELDHLERKLALALAVAARIRRASSGSSRVRMGDDLLALAGREHAVVQELRQRRRRSPSAQAA